MAAILLAPRINLIIVGTGNKMERLKPEMILELQKRGIGVEFCSSLKAVSLYNLLLSERDGEGVALFVKGNFKGTLYIEGTHQHIKGLQLIERFSN